MARKTTEARIEKRRQELENKIREYEKQRKMLDQVPTKITKLEDEIGGLEDRLKEKKQNLRELKAQAGLAPVNGRRGRTPSGRKPRLTREEVEASIARGNKRVADIARDLDRSYSSVTQFIKRHNISLA